MKDVNTICIITFPTSEATAAATPCRLTSAAVTLLPSLGEPRPSAPLKQLRSELLGDRKPAGQTTLERV